MKSTSIARCGIVAGAIVAAVGLNGSAAFGAAQVQHFNGDISGMPFNLGPSPVPLPQSCTFPNADANFVFLSGTGVFHGTANNNGDWGGETLQGTAVFYEDTTPIAQGHLTIWEGGGNNSMGQNEGGITVNFTGGGIQIHVNAHGTVPANSSTGLPTANVQNVTVTCS